MATILNLETSTTNCSVSIGRDGALMYIKENKDEGYSHAENLHLYVKEALTSCDLEFENLDAIAVSMGPGSYTGLRIGVSAAKGLCFAADKPLIAIPTLESLALQLNIDKGFILPLLDARRMEVYSAVFDSNHEQVRETAAEIITEDSFADLLEKEAVYFIGSGAQKCKAVIDHKNAHFPEGDFIPSAMEMVALAEGKFQNKAFEDVAYFEPFYLKDFVVTKPKPKL